MRISPAIYQTNLHQAKYDTPSKVRNVVSPQENISPANPFQSVPLEHKYGANITFGEHFDPRRTVDHIDFDYYNAMADSTKRRLRKRYRTFLDSEAVRAKLVDKKYLYMPLLSEKDMDDFIAVSREYFRYKENPIICLGRSPKWFLEAALLSEDGIHDYKFVAFSRFWYLPDEVEGVREVKSMKPTPKEIEAYRKYLRRIKADPKTIVEHMRKTGIKTVITDYVCSGKGTTSFLDIMGNYAKDLGILEEFSKSIQIFGIGSMEYMEELDKYSEYISIPTVRMPPVLRPYSDNIKQRFYDIKNFHMFKDMLMNQNTNECRSTYYPHEVWPKYDPDRFKTGLIHDIKKVEAKIKELGKKECFSSFEPVMFDFRNLLTFRILDALHQRKLLKAIHKTKI